MWNDSNLSLSGTSTTGTTINFCGSYHRWKHVHFRGTNKTHLRQTQRCVDCGAIRRLAAPRHGRLKITKEAPDDQA